MKVLFLALSCLSLAACATKIDYEAPSFSTPGSVLPKERVSPDSTFALRFYEKSGDPYYRYEIIDHRTGKVLGTASSGIEHEDIDHGKFHGTQDVLFASDGSGVIITENLSDAGPALFYILLSRRPDGTFKTRYLEPPAIFHRDCPAPAFSYERPAVTSLTETKIVFNYSPHKFRVMRLAKVPSEASIQALGDWHSIWHPGN